MVKLTKIETVEMVKKLIAGAKSGHNVGHYAVCLNMCAEEVIKDFFAVRGFVDVLKAALPESHHNIGWLAK